ncbi:hypothetical protein L195_g032435 [Trifolium pratense]|uniref:Uncharacterized protein n=1 Tax=Trifolium pratense TaxID=57577 RepID=A0A2K3LD70_TRIPR|nr:hypothetical protein L195_g032435 [Trifolium pratense]
MPLHHGPLLLGSNSTQPGNHGVGLRHHELCLCARIPPLSGHVPLVLQNSQAS